MVLWTIQSLEAWEALQRIGSLRCNSQFVDNDFFTAYKWMTQQMIDRLNVISVDDALPLWAWYQWDGEQTRKPDLRYSGHLSSGKCGVRIEFEIDEAFVLLSDFELWHYVLNYSYLPTSEAEGEHFEAELQRLGISLFGRKPISEPLYDHKIRESWLRIFDIEWSEEGLAMPRTKKQLQATFWELPLESVKAVDKFVAR